MEGLKTNYKKVENKEKQGIELYFDSIPSSEERNLLKEQGYRWNNQKKCWYIKANKLEGQGQKAIKTGYKAEPRYNYTQGAWEGINYDKHLELKEIAKIIKKELKRIYPDFNFSLTSELYSGGQALHIYLMSGTRSVYESYENALQYAYEINAIYETDNGLTDYDIQLNNDKKKYLKKHIENLESLQINQYYIEREYTLTEEARNMLKTAKLLADSFNYNDSDSMIDYFDTNFYLHLNVGKWNKPFEIIKDKKIA